MLYEEYLSVREESLPEVSFLISSYVLLFKLCSELFYIELVFIDMLYILNVAKVFQLVCLLHHSLPVYCNE